MKKPDKQPIIFLIRDLIERGIVKNESDLAQKIDYPQSTLSRITSGERGVPESLILKLREQYNASPAFLRGEAKEMYVNVKPAKSSESGVPYYDINTTAGDMTIYNGDHPEVVAGYVSLPGFADCNFVVPVYGSSMSPTITNGSLVACKKIEDKEIIQYGEIHLIVTKEQALVKRIKKGKDEKHWTLVSDNPEYDPFDIPKGKVINLFIVKHILNSQRLAI